MSKANEDITLKNYSPKNKWFKKGLVKIILYILGKELKGLSKRDKNIKNEIAEWEDRTIMLSVHENGPSVCVEKKGDVISFVDTKIDNPDISIYFKNVDVAFPTLLGRKSIAKAFSENAVELRGLINDAIVFIRVVEGVEAVLFPGFLQNKIFIRKPKFSWGRIGLRTIAYLKAVPFFIMGLFYKYK